LIHSHQRYLIWRKNFFYYVTFQEYNLFELVEMKYFLSIISDLHFSLSRKNVIYVQYIHYTNVFVGMPNSRLSEFI